MSMQNLTRSGGIAPGLPGARPFGSLSRRAAMVGAVAVAGLGARGVAQAADVMMPAAPDADLIGFADRVLALANRREAVTEHCVTLEDRVFLSCPKPDPLPKPTSGHSIVETTTATGTIYTIERPHERDPAWIRWEEATAAAKADHEQQEDAMAARLGLPEVQRRADRMSRRCDRWANQLVAMRPATVEGLSAKAGALVAVLGDDSSAKFGGLDTYADPVLSVLADAVRLGAGGQA